MAICQNCGNPNAGKRFCTLCGTELLTDLLPTPPAAISLPPMSGSASASDALVGRTLEQRYYLESKIGVGGMGTVYRARRLMIGDMAAVKVLHAEHLADSNAVERFRREAQTAARLKHPNVVKVYDFGVSNDGLAYLAMEFVEGENLGRLIERQGTLLEATTAEIIRQVCSAMEEAHRQGVVHRDIKPENILVRMRPNDILVKVLDFGVASVRDIAASKLTKTGNILGTPYYMSPEHCLGEDLDGRSDIYSLGIVLFEMLTGVLPFNSPTPTAVVIQQVNQAPPRLRPYNAKISPSVEAVVLHALEKRREARPQTAGDLANELIAAIHGAAASESDVWPKSTSTSTYAPVLASDQTDATLLDAPGALGKVAPIAESGNKLAFSLIGALLLVLALIGGGAWWYMQKDGAGEITSKSDSGSQKAKGNQQISAVGDQSAAANQNTVGGSPTPSSTTAQPATGKIWEIIPDQTSGATEAANALGAADRQMAVIKPGGQLALAYREGQFFGDGGGEDIRVSGPQQERVSYFIFVRNDSAASWQRVDINRKGFPQGVAGHDMGHHGVRQARQILIKNNGDSDLNIDAILAVYKEAVSSGGRPHHHR
jgi:serine/threonine protein kinase